MSEPGQAVLNGHVGLSAQIVAAYISNNRVPATELPALIASVHAALAGLSGGATPEAVAVEKLTPVQIRKSITPEALTSFEDGKPYKTLRRHLTLRGLSPEAYREKWGLPNDYPMTAQSYSEARSQLARSLGLGQKRHDSVPKAAAVSERMSEAPKRGRGRPKATG